MSVRPEKKEIVKEISKKLKESDAVILTDYRGLNVHDIADLRNKLREEEVEYKVFKNTLARIAVKKQGLDDLLDHLKGPTAFAFSSKGAVSVSKVLVNFAKEHEELEVKGGVIDQGIVSLDEIEVLAELPSREELIASLARQMQAPVQNFVSVLAQPAQKLVSTLSAVAEQK